MLELYLHSPLCLMAQCLINKARYIFTISVPYNLKTALSGQFQSFVSHYFFSLLNEKCPAEVTACHSIYNRDYTDFSCFTVSLQSSQFQIASGHLELSVSLLQYSFQKRFYVCIHATFLIQHIILAYEYPLICTEIRDSE